MTKTITLVSAAIAFATLGASAAFAAKNNPKFQAEMMMIARGEDVPPPAKGNASAPDTVSAIGKKAR